MKMLFILLIATHYSISLYSQDYKLNLEDIRKEVACINKEIVFKSILSNNGQKNIPITEYDRVIEDVAYIYFDIENNIKKSIHLRNHPEFAGFTIHYYGNSGDVIYTITQNRSSLEPAILGVRALRNSKLIYTDIQLNNDNNEIIEAKEFWGGEDIVSGDIIYNIKSIADLKKHLHQIYNIKEINSEDSVRVLFKLSIDEKTFINVRRLNLRAEPNLKSKITEIGGLGTDSWAVQVLDTINYENQRWCKIDTHKHVAYVLAIFLEPIESIQ
ncbi:SH3 domain-containing protein [Bacteroides sp. 519]|uniref:SH3 domain-containing protein n=1 Tax=Bacteroides sp. 519 TaxID=2302937 RepID=UPI0013D5EE34|nr:SH3 domain-containing protein [Bacteroides sp. 519]